MFTEALPAHGRDTRRAVAIFAGIVATYFVAGKLGLGFAALNASASAVWPPTGIAIAAVLLYGRRAWPAIFVAAFLVNVTTSASAAVSIAIAGGNTLEALAAAWLVQRYARGAACFERAGDVFRFAGLAAALATTLSASVGTASLVLAGEAGTAPASSVWLTWWLGDASGALLFTPLIVLWHRNRRVDLPEGRLGEAVVTLALAMMVGVLCFATPVLSGYPLVFLCVPPLVWVALRFGRRASASHVALLALIAVYTTERGVGPFVMATRNESLLVLQAFMATIALTMQAIAALVGEHARLLEELAAANRLERAARARAEVAATAREELLAMLSHELRNPLQAIASSVWLMDRGSVAGTKGARALEIVRRQTDQLSRVVNNLLDMARLSTGKVAIATRSVNVAHAVRRSVDAMQASGRLGRRTIEVEVEPLWLLADPASLDQMLAELLDKALERAQGGQLHVRARREDSEAVVRVHGEAAGPGSELVLRLPMQPRAAGPGAFEPGGEPRRVLIVEDNADVRDALRTLLEHAGHTVFEAEDGLAGIEAATRVQPDVALIDIGLPKLDGYQVAQRLRARYADLRLVALTGYGEAQDRRRARHAGFDEHLVKPVDPAALARALAVRSPVTA